MPALWVNRPLIVLTAANPYDPDPILTREQAEKLKNLWIYDLQVQEAHLSTRGKQIIVPDSTHMIPMDRPSAVVSAIHEVWSASGPAEVSEDSIGSSPTVIR